MGIVGSLSSSEDSVTDPFTGQINPVYTSCSVSLRSLAFFNQNFVSIFVFLSCTLNFWPSSSYLIFLTNLAETTNHEDSHCVVFSLLLPLLNIPLSTVVSNNLCLCEVEVLILS